MASMRRNGFTRSLPVPSFSQRSDTAPSALLRIFEDNPSAVLKKPFTAEELMRVIRRTLRQRKHEE